MKRVRNNLKWQKRNGKSIFWLFLFLIAATAFSYGYFVQSSVVAVVQRGAAEKERSVLASHIGELEAQYLKVKRSITAAAARAHGFENARVARFISKKTVTALRSGAEL